MISQRTKEALARKKAEGVVLGRPRVLNKYLKLNGSEDLIKSMLRNGYAKSDIMKKLKVSRITLNRFIEVKALILAGKYACMCVCVRERTLILDFSPLTL